MRRTFKGNNLYVGKAMIRPRGTSVMHEVQFGGGQEINRLENQGTVTHSVVPL